MLDESTDKVPDTDEVAIMDRSTGEVGRMNFKNPTPTSWLQGMLIPKFNVPPFFGKGESTLNWDGLSDPKYCAAN